MLNRTMGAALLCSAFALPAGAEVSEVRLSKQYGLPYLPMMVIEDQKLIEKHAADAGLGDVTVSWSTLGNSSAQIDALIAGQVDYIGPGVPTLATIWDKTAGTPQELKAVSAMQSMPYILVTNQPHIKTIADFTEGDRIALPAVKLTGHALALEMAAADLWGFENYDKLDPLTVSRPHPDAATALMSGQSEITAHFASAPYYYYELAQPGFHAVLKSYDVVGGKHTNGVLVTSKNFYEANPQLNEAVLSAFEEANEFITNNPRESAEIYARMTGEQATVDELEKMISDPDIEYTTTPKNVMAFVDFMQKVGRISKKPESWKDLFFETAHDLNGS